MDRAHDRPGLERGQEDEAEGKRGPRTHERRLFGEKRARRGDQHHDDDEEERRANHDGSDGKRGKGVFGGIGSIGGGASNEGGGPL